MLQLLKNQKELKKKLPLLNQREDSLRMILKEWLKKLKKLKEKMKKS